MNASELASLLNGREYGSEITKEEEAQAKADGLVVVFAYSDDGVDFRGAIDDEVGAYEGTTVWLGRCGILEYWGSVDHSDEDEAEAYFKKKAMCKSKIEAVWRSDGDGPTWSYKTSIPHHSFEILSDGEPYCRGIVFSVSDI